jgi:hypothetical protein
MVTATFLVLLLSPAQAEPPAAATQRAAAEALEAQAAYIAAGKVYFQLAGMSGVHRRDALDKARMNYDSDYMLSREPASLCRALGVAELVVEEGIFDDANEAAYWQDNVRDDLGRLRDDATKTGRVNCRFDGKGTPVRPKVTMLTDDAFAETTRGAPRRRTRAAGGATRSRADCSRARGSGSWACWSARSRCRSHGPRPCGRCRSRRAAKADSSPSPRPINFCSSTGTARSPSESPPGSASLPRSR